MEYRKINKKNDSLLVGLTLHLQDIKVLYNACVDIYKQFPDMQGYKNIIDKLELVIDKAEEDYIDVDLID